MCRQPFFKDETALPKPGDKTASIPSLPLELGRPKTLEQLLLGFRPARMTVHTRAGFDAQRTSEQDSNKQQCVTVWMERVLC